MLQSRMSDLAISINKTDKAITNNYIQYFQN